VLLKKFEILFEGGEAQKNQESKEVWKSTAATALSKQTQMF
tara:strand:+ start:148 stop:270 length:123 start_codon:yes stop_codon:yes gene_type:complete